MNLSNFVPNIFLGGDKNSSQIESSIPEASEDTKSIKGNEDLHKKENEEKPQDKSVDEDNGNDAESVSDEEKIDQIPTDTTSGEGSSTTSAALDNILSRLPSALNRDVIDKIAVDFCYLNSKSSRRRLINTLLAVPRTRLDLLSYYARLIATLNQHFPDIGESILSQVRNSLFLHLITCVFVDIKNIH